MNRSSLKPDLEQAKKFLKVLDQKSEFTFQTFDGNQDRSRKDLIRIFHGSLEQHAGSLLKLNQAGAGVFVTINQTDLLGRSKENIKNVRAVFADLDGAPLTPIIEHICEPHIIVESSPDRWHGYWLCDLPLEDFTSVQRSIASIFDGDRAICDLPRIMRLPGFIHQKVKNNHATEPFITRTEQLLEDLKPYSASEIVSHFPPKKASEKIGKEKFISPPPNENEIREVLGYLDPGDREQWIKVGHALKAIDENLLSIFLEFSRGDITGARPTNFSGDGDVIKTWNGFKPTRTGFSALVAIAKTLGYQPSPSKVHLKTGSQVEIATRLKPILTKEKYREVIYDQGSFWGYNETHWTEISTDEIRLTVHLFDGTKYGKNSRLKLSKNSIDGTINELSVICAKPGFFDGAYEGVNLLNGFIQIHPDGRISTEEHNPEHRQRFLLQHSFEPKLTSEWHGLLGTLFNGCFQDRQVEFSQLILEIFGCAMCGVSTKISAPMAFIFYGQSAANGKSQMQELLREILPANMTCSIPPVDLDKEQYLAKLAGKQANLSDEISNVKAIASDKFKAVITGDPVTAKAIYQQPIEFKPAALHILSTNILPSFKGGVDPGLERRLIVIPFDRTIPINERIPLIAKRIANEEGSTLVSEAIRLAAEVFKKGSYTLPDPCIEATKQWFIEVDPIKEWLEEGGLDRHKSPHGRLLKDLYFCFRQEMEDDGINYIPLKRRFYTQVRAFIATTPCWEERRTGSGSKVFASDLVTKMTNTA